MTRLSVHFYGSFDLVDIHPYLNYSSVDTIGMDRPDNYFSASQNEKKHVILRCGDNVIVQIRRNPLSKTEVIAEHFFADYLKLFLMQRFPSLKIKYYAPWNFSDSYLSIQLLGAGDINIKNDLIEPIAEVFRALPDSILKNWYYTRNTLLTNYLHADIESRLILRYLSGAYLGNRNLFFNIYPEYAFPVEAVKKNLMRLIDEDE